MSSVRHDFYQSSSHVFVSIFRKGVNPSSVKVQAQRDSVNVFVDDESLCSFEPLKEEIIEDQVAWKVFGTKIELTLPKRNGGRNWSSLTGDGTTTGTAVNMQSVAGPSSSQAASSSSVPSQAAAKKKEKKKWDEVVDQELGEEKQESADDFMKDLYSNASPEAQRAMLKSYQESGGTVLSTNWSDVGSRKVEVAPPEGMEAKPWKS